MLNSESTKQLITKSGVFHFPSLSTRVLLPRSEKPPLLCFSSVCNSVFLNTTLAGLFLPLINLGMDYKDLDFSPDSPQYYLSTKRCQDFYHINRQSFVTNDMAKSIHCRHFPVTLSWGLVKSARWPGMETQLCHSPDVMLDKNCTLYATLY